MNLSKIPGSAVLFLLLGAIAYFEFHHKQQQSTRPQKSIVAERDSDRYYQKWQLKEGSISDGKTLSVVRGNEELRLKLCGVNTPDKERKLGIESRNYLQSLVSRGGGTIFVTPVATDKHGSTIAELFVLLGNKKALLLNSQMIADGYARHDKDYSGNCPSRKGLVIAENIARDKKLGVWK